MGCGSSKRFDCPVCNLVSTTSVDALIRHVNASHALKCPYCSHSFRTGKDLIEHNIREHVIETFISCPKCERTITGEDKFIRHLEEVHEFRSRVGTGTENYSKTQEQVALAPTAFGLECPVCRKRDFTTGQRFVDHLETLHGFRPTEDRANGNSSASTGSSLHQEQPADILHNGDRRSIGNKNQVSRSSRASLSPSFIAVQKLDSPLKSSEQSRQASPHRVSSIEDSDVGKTNQAQLDSALARSSSDKLKIQAVDRLKNQIRSDQLGMQNGTSLSSHHASNNIHGEDGVQNKNPQQGGGNPFPSLKKAGRVRQRTTPIHIESPPMHEAGVGLHASIAPQSPADRLGSLQDDGKRSLQKSEKQLEKDPRDILPEAEDLGRQTGMHGSFRKDSNVPSVGSKVLASNKKLHWDFYFGRVLEAYLERLEFKVQWGASERDADVFDCESLALDRIPSPCDISVGTIVLFSQGNKKSSNVSGASDDASDLRWHQGIITRVYTDVSGIRRVDGHHARNEDDGKCLDFPGYSYEFKGLTPDVLRIPLNPYQIVNALETEDFKQGGAREVYDVFFACAQSGKYNWFRQDPRETISALRQPCDPNEVVLFLRGKGYSLYASNSSLQNIRKDVRAMRESKVYIACIDNDYAKSQLYNAQFQYAKYTLKMSMITLLFDGKDKAWTQTAVGQAMVNETSINFENRSVQHKREAELLTALKLQNVGSENHHEILESESRLMSSRADGKEAEIFIYYSWANSFQAKQLGQVPEVYGVEFSDPRLVNKKLVLQGYRTWIDEACSDLPNVHRSQMVSALKSAKVLVPFISSEYATDPTCMAVLRYAITTLKLPVIPVIVGQGDNWKSTATGSLLSKIDREPINLQYTSNELVLNMRLKMLMGVLDDIIKAPHHGGHALRQSRTRAPRARDRVVCRYTHHDYRMATVDSVNVRSLEYSVSWDDDDSQNRLQPFDKVALDVKPNADDVIVGSMVFVQQTPDPSGGDLQTRYFEGVVTKVTRRHDAVFVDGYHARQEPTKSSQRTTVRRQEFSEVPLSNLRIPVNMLDAVDSGVEGIS